MSDVFSGALGWLIVGIVLMVAELVLPGFVSVFLGAAAVIVAGLMATGLIGSAATAFIAWLVISIALVLSLRSTLMRFFPGDTSKGSVDEDAQAAGSIVVAATDVSPDDANGQVEFRETLWHARSAYGVVAKGMKARLVRREGLVWIVEIVRPD